MIWQWGLGSVHNYFLPLLREENVSFGGHKELPLDKGLEEVTHRSDAKGTQASASQKAIYSRGSVRFNHPSSRACTSLQIQLGLLLISNYPSPKESKEEKPQLGAIQDLEKHQTKVLQRCNKGWGEGREKKRQAAVKFRLEFSWWAPHCPQKPQEN